MLRLIAEGMTNQEIAAELFLGVNTVKTYIRTAYKKIDVESRSQAVVWAFRSGFVSLDAFDSEDGTRAEGSEHYVRHAGDAQNLLHD